MQFQKGHKKMVGSGRKKGTPNKTTAQIREAIVKGTKGFQKIIQIANGQTVTVGRGDDKKQLTPSIDEIVAANRVLIARTLPNLVAQHIELHAEINQNPAEGAKDRLREKLKVVEGNMQKGSETQ